VIVWPWRLHPRRRSRRPCGTPGRRGSRPAQTPASITGAHVRGFATNNREPRDSAAGTRPVGFKQHPRPPPMRTWRQGRHGPQPSERFRSVARRNGAGTRDGAAQDRPAPMSVRTKGRYGSRPWDGGIRDSCPAIECHWGSGPSRLLEWRPSRAAGALSSLDIGTEIEPAESPGHKRRGDLSIPTDIAQGAAPKEMPSWKGADRRRSMSARAGKVLNEGLASTNTLTGRRPGRGVPHRVGRRGIAAVRSPSRRGQSTTPQRLRRLLSRPFS